MFVKLAAEPLLDYLGGDLHVGDQAVLTLHVHRHEGDVAHHVRQSVCPEVAPHPVGGDLPVALVGEKDSEVEAAPGWQRL